MRTTVIIPTHNRREKLLFLLRTMELQTCSSFDVVVADLGSTDGTVEAVQSMLAKSSYPLRLVTTKDGGSNQCELLNLAARIAWGELLVFLGGNHIPTTWWLASFLAVGEHSAPLYGDILYVPDEHHLDEVICHREPVEGERIANFCIPKKLLAAVGGLVPNWEERLLHTAKQPARVPNAFVYHLGPPKQPNPMTKPAHMGAKLITSTNFASRLTFSGRVFSGLHVSPATVRMYRDTFVRATGMELLPGTLNIRLDRKLRLRYEVQRDGPLGMARLCPLHVEHIAAFSLRGCRGPYGSDVIEAMADVHFRHTLGLQDGDRVKVYLDAVYAQ